MAFVYLDHNATTPLDPRAREAMLPWLGEQHGNPSSVHRFGQAARNAVEVAREKVAALLAAEPPALVFTASGTEANNAVVLGCVRRGGPGGHLVISALEHPSVREAAAVLEREGTAVTRVAPGPDGVVSADAMIAALRPDTRLVCLMLANNELGTLQPVAEVAAACRA
ncbi:MAG TPA: aminotransferase class V-fold PLP-dependent enzyme, partial [Thermoanaerobaculia bacterium]